MLSVLTKAVVIWLLLAVVAVLNGLARDELLSPGIGAGVALPLSGISLALAILLVTWLLIPWIGRHRSATYLAIGLLWVAMTLCFEYLFGHFVAGKSWQDIEPVFDVARGNLFSLALFVTGIAPWLAARIRGLI